MMIEGTENGSGKRREVSILSTLLFFILNIVDLLEFGQ